MAKPGIHATCPHKGCREESIHRNVNLQAANTTGVVVGCTNKRCKKPYVLALSGGSGKRGYLPDYFRRMRNLDHRQMMSSLGLNHAEYMELMGFSSHEELRRKLGVDKKTDFVKELGLSEKEYDDMVAREQSATKGGKKKGKKK